VGGRDGLLKPCSSAVGLVLPPGARRLNPQSPTGFRNRLQDDSELASSPVTPSFDEPRTACAARQPPGARVSAINAVPHRWR